jgi:hypothetical protein
MILTGETRSTEKKTCPSATWSTTNLTWTGWDRPRVFAVRARRLPVPWHGLIKDRQREEQGDSGRQFWGGGGGRKSNNLVAGSQALLVRISGSSSVEMKM